jgi:hypothetical protein
MMETAVLVILLSVFILVAYFLPLIGSWIAAPYVLEDLFKDGKMWSLTVGDILLIVGATMLSFIPILNWILFIFLGEEGYLKPFTNWGTEKVLGILNIRVIGRD